MIKVILHFAVLSGAAYLAYRLGKDDGIYSERYRSENDTHAPDGGEDEDYVFYDEPEEECFLPENETTQSRFPSLRSLGIEDVSRSRLEELLFYLLRRNHFFCTEIKQFLNVTGSQAERICRKLEQAGYIGKETQHRKHHVNYTFDDLSRLMQEK